MLLDILFVVYWFLSKVLLELLGGWGVGVLQKDRVKVQGAKTEHYLGGWCLVNIVASIEEKDNTENKKYYRVSDEDLMPP